VTSLTLPSYLFFCQNSNDDLKRRHRERVKMTNDVGPSNEAALRAGGTGEDAGQLDSRCREHHCAARQPRLIQPRVGLTVGYQARPNHCRRLRGMVRHLKPSTISTWTTGRLLTPFNRSGPRSISCIMKIDGPGSFHNGRVPFIRIPIGEQQEVSSRQHGAVSLEHRASS
jgi:hypothetical protein